MNIYAKLFISFAKIGLFTFGGGYAMLPMLKKEVVEKNKWATEEELMDYYAIGQCTPGVIAVNTATFIGYSLKKIPGAITATLAVISPSLVIITLIAAFISHFSDIEIVAHALAGVRIAVCALVTVSVAGLLKKCAVDILTVVLFILTFAVTAFFGISPVISVIVAAAVGILAKTITEKRKAGAQK